MKPETFNLIDAINTNDLSNSEWGVIESGVYTQSYFGTTEQLLLTGQWLFVYRYSDDASLGAPVYTMKLEDSEQVLDLYKLC